MTLARTRWLAPALVLALVVVVAALAVMLLVVRSDRDPRTFYLSPDGSDDASGSSPGSAWRSLSRVGHVDLVAGDRILLSGRFDRERLYLPADASGTEDQPIVVASYGAGRATISGSDGTCLRVDASWVTVRHVTTRECAFSGISVSGDHVSVEHVESTGNLAGVRIAGGADHATVRHSNLHDNTTMNRGTTGPDDDSGAFGVVVNGDHALITRNTISGQSAPSADYGTDGSAVEIFGAEHTVVSYNVARDNHTFTELGGSSDDRSSGTTYAYNQVTSRQPNSKFVVTRGGGTFGRVAGTLLVHNTAVLSGPGTEGVVCGPSCEPEVLTMRANLVVASYRSASVSGTYAESRNILSGGRPKCVVDGRTTPCPDRFVVDPGVDASGRYVRLRADSPAIDSGGVAEGYDEDIAGQAVPTDGNGAGGAFTDVGAWEKPAPVGN